MYKIKQMVKNWILSLKFCRKRHVTGLQSLLDPIKPETKSFGEIVALVEKHHNPEPLATVQRYKFYSRCRQPEETVLQYVAELRRIAERY